MKSTSYVLLYILIITIIQLLIWNMEIFTNRSNAYDFSFSLPFGVIFDQRSNRSSTNDIQTVESLGLSRKKSIKGAKSGIRVGLIIGLYIDLIIGIIGIIYILFNVHIDWSDAVLLLIPPFWIAIFSGIIGAVFGGISIRVVEARNSPNQGIWLSLRNAIIAGLCAGFVLMLIIVVASLNSVHFDHILIVGLLGSMSVGLLFFLWYGGLDVIQHYTLRFLLWRDKETPWNYAKFLDHCVDRIFMQKVGGGYIFIHRMLMEYFANLEPESISEGNPKGRSR